ncbi:CHAD domain-containing protein [Magnetococcales bacterium HHB-1]
MPVGKKAPITRKQTVEEAFSLVLMTNYKYMKSFEKMAYDGKNVRGVHQMRVAIRRIRSSFGVFRRAVPRELAQPMAVEWKWAASEMGNARDVDVFITETLDVISGKVGPKAGEQKLRKLAEDYQANAYKKVRAMIDSGRYKKLNSAFVPWAKGKWGKTSPATRKALCVNVVTYAEKELNRRLNKILMRGKNITQISDDERHNIRIACKKLRYAAEFFKPLYGRKMTDFIQEVKVVQKILGSLQDASVMPGLLAEITAGSKDPDVQAYVKNLIKWREQGEKKSMKSQLGKSWQRFSKVKPPWKGGRK